MRRKRKSGGKYHHKVRLKPLGVSGERISSPMCAIRFYWAGRRYTPHKLDASLQKTATYDLAIRCQARQTTPTQFMMELSLAMLISSWMRWLYVRQDRPSKG